MTEPGPAGRMARRNDAVQGGAGITDGLPSGKEVGGRVDLLLHRFVRADGEPWRPVEIEEATGGQVTSSYVSALTRGKFRRPGIKQLSLIADVMGFPFELWRMEPELWDEELKKHKTRGGFRAPSRGGQPVPRVPCGDELAGLVDALFAHQPDPATGEPYTEEGVAMRSRGRLSAEEVRLFRAGEQLGPPPEIKLLALADVFDVAASYWYAPQDSTAGDEVRTSEAILEACGDLTGAELEAVLAFARHVCGRRDGASSDAPSTAAGGHRLDGGEASHEAARGPRDGGPVVLGR